MPDNGPFARFCDHFRDLTLLRGRDFRSSSNSLAATVARAILGRARHIAATARFNRPGWATAVRLSALAGTINLRKALFGN